MLTSRFLIPSVLGLVIVACGGETVNVGSTSQMELKKKADGSPTGNGQTCSWDDAVSSDGNTSSSPNGQYTVGDQFASPDGCNSCACTKDGIACTTKACSTPPGGPACTDDAKVCPDGSYVSRTGPNCEFAPCPEPQACPAIARMCNDGSTAKPGPNCTHICPEDGGCKKTGCSSHICSDQDVASTCEWQEEYACYQTAACERQADGKCGFTQTPELASCLASK